MAVKRGEVSQLLMVFIAGLEENWGQRNFTLPGAGASWWAEPQAVLTSEVVEASSWLGYSATVPATEDNEQKNSVKCSNWKYEYRKGKHHVHKPAISVGRGTSWELVVVPCYRPRNHSKNDENKETKVDEVKNTKTRGTYNRIFNVKVNLPSKDWKRASSWLGRIGPLLGPMCPHEGAKTDLSSHPLCFDWAYKPGGVGRGSGGERRRIGRGKGQRWKWNDIKNVMEKKNGYNKNCENIKKGTMQEFV